MLKVPLAMALWGLDKACLLKAYSRGKPWNAWKMMLHCNDTMRHPWRKSGSSIIPNLHMMHCYLRLSQNLDKSPPRRNSWMASRLLTWRHGQFSVANGHHKLWTSLSLCEICWYWGKHAKIKFAIFDCLHAVDKHSWTQDGVAVNQERLQPMLDDPKQFRSQLKLLNQINKIISINEEENTGEKDFRLPFLDPFSKVTVFEDDKQGCPTAFSYDPHLWGPLNSWLGQEAGTLTSTRRWKSPMVPIPEITGSETKMRSLGLTYYNTHTPATRRNAAPVCAVNRARKRCLFFEVPLLRWMQQNELRCLAEGLLFLVRQNDLLPLSDDFWQREMCANRKNMTHMYDEYISACSQYICIYIYTLHGVL